MNKSKLLNGIVLIGIGVFFLLVNLGYVSFSILFGIFDLWPLILIVVGVNILFKKKSIVSFITWILFFIVLILYGTFYQGRNIAKGEWVRNNINVKKHMETSYAKLDLDIGAAKINVGSEVESLLVANLKGRDLDYNETYKNNKETAQFSFESKNIRAINLKNNNADYSFNLNKDIIWDLDLDLGAVSGKLNLEEVPVRSIDLDFGAGNIDIVLGTKYNNSNIKIDSGASNLTIVVPKDAGVKLKLDTALTKTNIDDLNLTKSGDYYLSSNYEEANTKLEFDIDMGAGKIDFKIK